MVDAGNIDVLLNGLKSLGPDELNAIASVYGEDAARSLQVAQAILSAVPLQRLQRLVETPLCVRRPLRGAVKDGSPMQYTVAFNAFGSPTKSHFSTSVLSASSATARVAVAENLNLRHIHVGCVVTLRNPDTLTEHWFVYVTRLYTDPNQPNLIGEGLWVFNQEDFSKVDPRVILEDRSGVLSNYRVVLFATQSWGFARSIPRFWIPNRKTTCTAIST